MTEGARERMVERVSRRRGVDMLRTKVAQAIDPSAWQITNSYKRRAIALRQAERALKVIRAHDAALAEDA